MPKVDDLLFTELLGLSSIDKEKAAYELSNLIDRYSYQDTFRNCRILPLYTKQKHSGLVSSKDFHTPGNYEWQDYCPQLIIDWCENNVFNWMSVRARLVLIYTEAMQFNSVHIDCAPKEFGLRQHKFRYVLQGTTDSLFFLTQQGKIYAPCTDYPFVMDGSWPHGLENNKSFPKLTLAIGGPWTGEENYKGNNLLKRSDFQMVSNREDFFDPRHEMSWLNKSSN